MADVDKDYLIRTSEAKKEIIIFGDGIIGGEIWDSTYREEDGLMKRYMFIKMTNELRARFGHLMKPNDLKDGFTEWSETKELLIPMTENPSLPIVLATRNFNHQPTPVSKFQVTLIETMKRMSKEIANYKMGVHAEQENFRRWMEGGAWIRMKELMKEAVDEGIGKLASILTKGK